MEVYVMIFIIGAAIQHPHFRKSKNSNFKSERNHIMKKNKQICTAPISASADCISDDFLFHAAGKVAYRLTNDYLFHAVLQKNNKVLKALLCSLLRFRQEDIRSVLITNPIEFGESVKSKNFLLDIRILMNDNTLVNLEMQVANEGNWPERSLSYLCRSFDNLNAGMNYMELKPAIHISILDFTLFPDMPEFYSSYYLMNRENHTVYSDKLQLSVLNLPQIHLATETDKAYHLDDWAALFHATTWEDIKMIASENDMIQEAAETMYRLSQNEKVRLQCEARERYYRDQKTRQYQMEKMKEMEKKMGSMETELEAAGEKLKLAAGELEMTEEKLEVTEEKLEMTEEKLEVTEGELEAAEGKLEAAEEKLEATEGKLETAVINLRQQEGTIREKDVQLAKKQAEIDMLRAELERVKAEGRR